MTDRIPVFLYYLDSAPVQMSNKLELKSDRHLKSLMVGYKTNATWCLFEKKEKTSCISVRRLYRDMTCSSQLCIMEVDSMSPSNAAYKMSVGF